jgi:transcription antitermination factor NusG
METIGQDQIESRRSLMGYSMITTKMNGETAPTCKKSITGLVGCGAAPRCVSEIAPTHIIEFLKTISKKKSKILLVLEF